MSQCDLEIWNLQILIKDFLIFFAENTSFLAIIHSLDVNRGFLSKMHL